jgi:mannitol-1-phosphate/altronate dehydrogenase
MAYLSIGGYEFIADACEPHLPPDQAMMIEEIEPRFRSARLRSRRLSQESAGRFPAALRHRCAQIAMDGSQNSPRQPRCAAAGSQSTVRRMALAWQRGCRFFKVSDSGTEYRIDDQSVSG